MAAAKEISGKCSSRLSHVLWAWRAFTRRCGQNQGDALVPSSLRPRDNAKLEKIIHQEYPFFHEIRTQEIL
ncbi:MAG: hypothetical protein HC916_01460 [Coleofasciculaceae cyanobacterium SM2_1_6]|nr:hypothetical protein [Coleofasciculaceae cyanobacterium SM2_1_6]